MKAYIDNKITEIEIKDKKYNDHAVEAVIKSGKWAGTWVIVEKKDLIAEPKKPTFKDVDFSKCYEYSFGENGYFWRADFRGQTIATMCRTKAECITEAREYLRSL